MDLTISIASDFPNARYSYLHFPNVLWVAFCCWSVGIRFCVSKAITGLIMPVKLFRFVGCVCSDVAGIWIRVAPGSQSLVCTFQEI